MTLKEFEKATGLLKFAFENTLSMDASYIDELFRDNRLDDVKEEMKRLGVLVFRKKKSDYFVPWHKNLFGENTIDSVRNELIFSLLKEDIEYQELLQKQKKLSEELEDINYKLEMKKRVVLTEQRNNNNNNIPYTAEQIKSLKVSDEPDEIDDINSLL